MMQRRSTALTLFLAITSCYLAADEKAPKNQFISLQLRAKPVLFRITI